MKRYAKFGYAASLRFRVILEKPQGGGGQNDPPPGRRLNLLILTPFLPCNAIGLILTFEIIGLTGTPKSIQIDCDITPITSCTKELTYFNPFFFYCATQLLS